MLRPDAGHAVLSAELLNPGLACLTRCCLQHLHSFSVFVMQGLDEFLPVHDRANMMLLISAIDYYNS